MFNNKGFTLIELIIVMIIIAILVLLAAPKFMNYLEEAKLTQIKNDTKVVHDILLIEYSKSYKNNRHKDNLINQNKTKDIGISKDNNKLINIYQGEGVQVTPEFIKEHTNTKLNPEEFYFNKEDNKVFYYYDKAEDSEEPNEPNEPNEPEITKEEELYQLATHIYDISLNDNNITVNGFKDNYKELLVKEEYEMFKGKDIDGNLEANIQTLTILEITGDKVVRIGNNAFRNSKFIGNFPKLDNLQTIGQDVFYESKFTGNFPQLDNLQEIGWGAFKNSNFTGELNLPEIKEIGELYPQKSFVYGGAFQGSNFTSINIPKVEIIGDQTFRNSKMTGNFPKLDNLQEIGWGAFKNSNFTGEFPQLDNLQEIDSNAFYSSNFTGNFPKLDNLQKIGNNAFRNSNFTGKFPNINSLVNISNLSFKFSTFEGEFPRLNNLEIIGSGAFENSTFVGSLDLPELRELGLLHEDRSKNYVSAFDKSDFSSVNIPKIEIIGDKSFHSSKLQGKIPHIPNVKKIGNSAFRESKFTGEFPKLDNLQEIGEFAFRKSNFTGEFPKLDNLQEIGNSAFDNSNFTGEFPQLDNLQKIDNYAFYSSKFTGDFPKLDKLEIIKSHVFYNSKFNIPDYYNGWDGINEWIKE